MTERELDGAPRIAWHAGQADVNVRSRPLRQFDSSSPTLLGQLTRTDRARRLVPGRGACAVILA
jgi:hypothetical protein